MKYLAIFIFCALWTTLNVYGDGGIIPPSYEEIYETGQTALITVRDGKETIIPLIEVSGAITEFIWLFPCPSIPGIDSANVGLFFDLASWSAPKYVERGWQGCCGAMQPAPDGWEYDGRGEQNGVDPIGNGSVGFLNYEILYATDAAELVLYLEGNGYSVPQDAEPIFQYYIEKEWNYFIAALCDTQNASWSPYGTNLQPMVISFDATDAVYPLRISRIGSVESEIVLYTIGENKMAFSEAQVKFAKRISQDFIDAIEYSEVSEHLWNGCFLTKSYAMFATEHMHDLPIEFAGDNDEFQEIYFYSRGSLDAVVMVCCIGFFLVYRRRTQKGGQV
jgi:hypothetical protein